MPLVHADLGQVLLDAAAEHYERRWPTCSLIQFEQAEAFYLFDLAGAVGAAHADRTVVAWAVTPSSIAKRDVSYQRGFPLPPDPDGTPVDRGWSEEGKRFRALEREAAAAPGTFYFAHLLYDDDTDYPTAIETGLLRASELHVDRFHNRFPPN